jgi:predicted SnoaL-like aldol condensation-catalyzing enzyme
MSNSSPERNKVIVLEAFETLFNKRDYIAAERFWSPAYIQHSAHIAPGREGLFNLVGSAPETLHYENQLIIAEGDYVIAHGRFTGMGRPLTDSALVASSCKTSQCSLRRPSSNRITSAAIQAAGLPIPVKRPCAMT